MIHRLSSILLLFLFPAFCSAEKPGKFAEGRHGKGSLRYVDGIPVVIVEGTPDEIGEQFGTLAVKQAKPMLSATEKYMKEIGLEKAYPLMLIAAGNLLKSYPEDSRKEIAAASRASGIPRDLIAMLNAFPDLMKIGGCSTLIVNPERSKTKGVIYGRLLDWPPFEGVPEHTVILVVRPKGKHACALVTIPPILGCISGMNDAGLCIAMNLIDESKDESSRLNTSGTPTMLLMRQILEECTTVAQAETMLRKSKPMIRTSLTVCDKEGGCVMEVTPKTVVRRDGENGICCCTNHFRTDDLSVDKKCPRYSSLEKVQNGSAKLSVDDVAKELHKVNQKEYTIHAIIFEPAGKTLHLSVGIGKSATEMPLKKIDLGKLFEKGFGDPAP